MNKIINFITLMTILSLVSAFRFDFQVNLAPIKNPDGYWRNLTGLLTPTVYIGNLQLTKPLPVTYFDQTNLVQGSNYTTTVYYCPYNLITNVTFQWQTMAYQPKFLLRKPKIFLSKFIAIPTYIQDPVFRQQETKYFCPENPYEGVEPNEELKLVRC